MRRLVANAHDLKDSRGATIGCVIHLRDVTERILMEEQMWRMEQFASLSTLASGLHHEIKNPLTALSIHVQLLEERLRCDRGRRAGRRADRRAEVRGPPAQRHARQLPRLRQPPAPHLKPVDVAGAPRGRRPADRARRRPSSTSGSSCCAPRRALPRVPLDAEKFKQAVLNLVLNALEAMPEGGDLILRAAVEDGRAPRRGADTGPGIPPEIQDHLFQPYFSTKDRGTGMGLALAEKLVRQHGGQLDFRTGPRRDDVLDRPPPRPSRTGASAGHEHRSLPHPDRRRRAEHPHRAGPALEDESYEISTAKDADEAWALFRSGHHHLVITDLKMPGRRSGIDLVRSIKHERPETLILVITAHGTVETAVEAMRLGAHDYLAKPVDLEMLRLQVRNAFEHHRLREENRRLRDRLAAAGEFPEMIGQSAAIREVFAQHPPGRRHRRHGPDPGRERHGQGARRPGHPQPQPPPRRAVRRRQRRGPARGADRERAVRLREGGLHRGPAPAGRAGSRWRSGGTLLLDEVGEMVAKTQVDLLRVLEQREVRRLGGEALIPLDVRLVAATHQDVDELVAERQDARGPVLPPQRHPAPRPPAPRAARRHPPARRSTSSDWAQQRHGREPKQVAGAAMRALCDYSWPGNVRQLKNCIERLVVTVEGPDIHLEDLPKEMHAPRPSPAVDTWPGSILEPRQPR